MKVNAGMSKVMIMNGEEVLECEVHIHRIHLEHVPVLMYGSETMLQEKKQGSRITAVKMDNLRGLLGVE